jgi:hypothetical protein
MMSHIEKVSGNLKPFRFIKRDFCHALKKFLRVFPVDALLFQKTRIVRSMLQIQNKSTRFAFLLAGFTGICQSKNIKMLFFD